MPAQPRRGCSGRDRILGVGPHDGRRDPPRGVVEVAGTDEAAAVDAARQRARPPIGTAERRRSTVTAPSPSRRAGCSVNQRGLAYARAWSAVGCDLGGTCAHCHGLHFAPATVSALCIGVPRAPWDARRTRVTGKIIAVKTRSRRLTRLAVRIVPIAAVLTVLETGHSGAGRRALACSDRRDAPVSRLTQLFASAPRGGSSPLPTCRRRSPGRRLPRPPAPPSPRPSGPASSSSSARRT